MSCPSPLPTCWIIDHNEDAAKNLQRLIETEGFGQVLGTCCAVRDWHALRVDYLFIRITAWDDYLRWRGTDRWPAADTIIFLSGRFEKGTRHLRDDLDFHLRPPYQASRVAEILRRRIDPDFHPRSPDLFFLNIRYRFQVVYFSDLWYIQGNGGGTVRVQTARGVHTVSGTLEGFQRRLPIPWQRANRSLLVAQYEPGSFEKIGRSFG